MVSVAERDEVEFKLDVVALRQLRNCLKGEGAIGIIDLVKEVDLMWGKREPAEKLAARLIHEAESWRGKKQSSLDFTRDRRRVLTAIEAWLLCAFGVCWVFSHRWILSAL